ncbi:MAG: hypothetical protein ACOVO1_01780 [Chitinophagaceae bacterium]
MKIKIVPLLIFLFAFFQAHSTIRRVEYTATIQAVNNLDYVNFQAAHDASANGDTIQLYPGVSGTINYTGTISKPLVILGVGYYTNSYYLSGTEIANANLQNLVGLINSCNFVVNLGSAGTIFQGLNNLTVTTTPRVDSLNNITISRCKGVSVVFDNSGVCNNWLITQCYGAAITQTNVSGSFTGNRTITNMVVRNCLMGNVKLSTSPVGTFVGNKIYNSVFPGTSLELSNAPFTIQNCIFNGQSFTTVANTVFIKNLTTQTATSNPINTNPGSSGNLFGVNMANVFVGYPTNPQVGGKDTYSPDAKFQLKAASPALNAGFLPGTSTATDCGMYGYGANAYKLSGMPAIPIFTKLNAPSAIYTGSPYTMTFSIISNN